MKKYIQKILFSLFILYGIFGFFVLPLILKPQLTKLVSEQLNAKLEIDSLSINPFLFKFRASDVVLRDLKNKELLRFESLFIDYELYPLFRGVFHIGEITLVEPKVLLVRQADASLNLLNILKPKDQNAEDINATSPKSELPRIILDRLSIQGGVLEYEDYTLEEPFRFALRSIGIVLSGLDSDESNGLETQLRLYATLDDGGFLDFKSEISSLASLKAEGSLDFESSKLYSKWKYIQDRVNVEVAEGKVSLQTNYSFALEDINATKLDNLSLQIEKLRIKAKEKAGDILNIESLSLKSANIYPFLSTVNIEKIAMQGTKVSFIRDKDGKIDWTEYIKYIPEKTSTKSSTEEIPKEPKSSYALLVKEFTLEDSAVTFSDNSLKNPTKNEIDHINASVQNISLQKDKWLSYDLSMKLNSEGEIHSKGQVSLEPLKQEGTLELKGLSLKSLSPYIQERAYVSVEDGKLSLSGKTHYEKRSDDADLHMEGSVSLDSFVMHNSASQMPLITLKSATVESYTLELTPDKLNVDALNLNSFFVDVNIDKDATLNFSKLSQSKKQKNTETFKSEVKTESDFAYRVARVNFTDGSANFADYSIPLKFSTHIHDIEGSIYSISSNKGDTSYVDIAGAVDEYASARLKGSVDSANPKAYTDLDLNFKNLDLGSLSGYSARFAGREIESGKLSLDLSYDIRDAQLLATNSIVIKKIKLGKVFKDENATHLPLSLLIGLLENSNGVINIDLPVKGNLNNPDFEYRKLLLKTIANLVKNVVTLPFRFLAATVGLNADDAEYIAFEAGSAKIEPPQKEKLSKIADLISKKPKIILEIAGQYEVQKDTQALQMKKLISLAMKKSGIENKRDYNGAMNIEILEEIYEQSKTNKELKALQERLSVENKEPSAYEKAYRSELIEECRNMQSVEDEELIALAKQRANSIVNYLVEEKTLSPKRVELKPVYKAEKSDEKFVKLMLEVEVK